MSADTLTAVREQFELADRDTRHALIVRGAMFASFTIRTSTETAEDDYQNWISAGADLVDIGRVVNGHLITSRQHRADSLAELTTADTERIASLPSFEREREFTRLVWGYGPAKASFALACAGVGYVACIDGLLARKHADKLAPLGYRGPKQPSAIERKTSRGWQLYAAAVEAIWPNAGADSARAQWFEWLADRVTSGREIDHALLTRGIGRGRGRGMP